MMEALKFVPISHIHLHESHEESRLQALSDKITTDGYLQNPLLVTPMENNHYFVIDGVHRFNSLRLAGCARIPVQVVNPEQMQLSSWAHEVPAGEWLEGLYSNTAWEWRTGVNAETEWFACLLNANGTKDWVVPRKPLQHMDERLEHWHTIVNSYLGRMPLKRIASDTEELPVLGHVRFIYPTWTVKDIENAVAIKAVLPPGTTRFIVPNRLENLSIPLHLLMAHPANDTPWDRLKKCWLDLMHVPATMNLPSLENAVVLE